jgi:hyaluronate lyase
MTASLRYLVENVWDFHPGANALWAALVHVRFGLVTGEENHLDLARTWVDRSCEISDWQGILKDYSYSFHGHGINMGYGTLHFNYVGQFVYLMENSRWRMKEHTLGNVVNMLLEFVQWQIVGKTIDPFIIDRGISAKDEQAADLAVDLIDGALLLSSGPIPRGDEVRQCCRKILDQGCLPRNPVAIELAARLQVPAVAPLYGMRYWPETEHFVAREPGWTVAVKMASEKNKAYFGINRTNLKGWHISDGHLVFRRDGDEFLDDTLATMDWERLTGITRAASFKLPEETRGQSWFACGVTNRRATRGCCCLDFMLRTLDRHMLTARKSWFFLGDAVVAMGTGISCSNDDEVETIVQQIKLPDTQITETETSHEEEILSGPFGSYVFPNRTPVRVRIQYRSGRWSDLRSEAPLSPLIVKPYWLAFIPHGRHPQNDSYLYVYLPGMNAEQAEQWWRERPFDVIRQDDLAHAILDRRTGETLLVRQWVGATVEPEGNRGI